MFVQPTFREPISNVVISLSSYKLMSVAIFRDGPVSLQLGSCGLLLAVDRGSSLGGPVFLQYWPYGFLLATDCGHILNGSMSWLMGDKSGRVFLQG